MVVESVDGGRVRQTLTHDDCDIWTLRDGVPRLARHPSAG